MPSRISPLLKSAAALLAIAGISFLAPLPSASAADHGDAPTLAPDQGADIADLYFFLDPTDQTKAVIIGTSRGFITPGEAVNFAVFDPLIQYRFEIFNDHVNLAPPASTATSREKKAFAAKVKPNKTIDVTFSKRTADPAATNLPAPIAQRASLKLTGFGKTVLNRGIFPDLATTPPTLTTAATQTVTSIDTGVGTIDFFAGEVDDPFFFDIPGFSAFVASARAGSPNPGVFSRARDTFAGYNVLAIAIRLPVTMLKGTGGTIVGVDFLTQRHVVQTPLSTGEVKGVGAYKTVDRIANPGVNVALIPFNKKNSYNGSTPKDDVNGKFAGDIVTTVGQFGLSTNAASVGILAGIALAHGDILQLETDVTKKPNIQTGNGGGGNNVGSGFPNGRRLMDDVIDTILTVINNGGTVGDGANASDVLPTNAFPFVAQPTQPFANGTVDDRTRN